MPFYIPRAIVIEARQYTLESRDELINWCGAKHSGIGEDGAQFELKNLLITTPEGVLTAEPGSYVVKGTHGEFYPVKKEIFEHKYEPKSDSLRAQNKAAEPLAMKLRFIFAWYDLWVGAYWDREHKELYLLPIPCCGVVVSFGICNHRWSVWYSHDAFTERRNCTVCHSSEERALVQE